MRDAGLDYSSLHTLSSELSKIVEETPKIQRALHEEIAAEMKRALDGSISSALNDSHGHVKSWQQPHVGSFGGYAAVRPDKSSVRRGKNTYRVGLITSALEYGHRIRPAGDAPPRIKTSYVSGRHFYSNTWQKLERTAVMRAERIADKLRERLEGRK